MLGQETSFTDGFGLVAIVLAATTFSLIMLRRRLASPITGESASRDHMSRLREQNRMRDMLDDLLIQLEDVNRRINAQLDTKFVKLETIIDHADARIARLETLVHAAPEPLHPDGRTSSGEVKADSSNARTEREIPRNGAGSPVIEQSQAVPSPDPRPPISPHHQCVYELRDQGVAPIDIAEKLQVPLGEIELILNLRNYR